jgi:hypothetical protein
LESHTARGIERALGAVCGLVPLAGLLFFGWSVAAVIFLLWLDVYLASLRMVPANLYWIKKDLVRDPLGPRNPVLDRISDLGLAMLMWIFLALPVMIAGRYLDALVAQFHPGGLKPVAYDLFFEAPWSIVLLAGGRVYQCIREFAAARAAGESRFAQMIKVLYGQFLCKGMVLFAFAAWTLLFGIAGYRDEVMLVAATIVGLVAIEWYADYRLNRVQPPDPGASLKKTIEVVHGFDGRNDRR